MDTTSERRQEQPYLKQINEPLYEQWYLLHHRLVRVVTNRQEITVQIRHFLYYAELLIEATYDTPGLIPVDVPERVRALAGARLHRQVALTCYLFHTEPQEPFPPFPAEAKPDDVAWEGISGVDGPQRGRWKRGTLRFREYQAYPGVTSRICSVMDKAELHATVFIEDISQCASWFVMRFVFYMIIGAMLGSDGYEIVHAGAVAFDEQASALLVGSPGSGKSTLVLACLHAGLHLLADDVLFLAKDSDIVRVYAFPEDIGVREGTQSLLGQHDFMQTLAKDNREKAFVNVQQHFQGQFVSSCPLRLLLFINANRRADEFRAEPISPAQAVGLLMQEYVSYQRARGGEANTIFNIFSDIAAQAPTYRLWLTPDAERNARGVLELLASNALHDPL